MGMSTCTCSVVGSSQGGLDSRVLNCGDGFPHYRELRTRTDPTTRRTARACSVLGFGGLGGLGKRMATDASPLTRAELREELDRTLQHYATKADLANLKFTLAAWMLLLVSAATGIIIAVDRLAG